MRVTFRDHNGKGLRLAAALLDAGYELVVGCGDVALLDADVPFEPYRSICDAHDRVFVYPHGGGNPFAGEVWPTHPNTACRFVPGAGQADVFDLCGYPVPVEVIGWPFCDLLPFRAIEEPVEVLFAPQHPLSDGWITDGCRESNARIHDMLAELPVHLTVRYVQVEQFGVEHVGITRRPSVVYREAPLDVANGVGAIDAADVVVAAEGTFPSLAVARGCPTVMCGQVAPVGHQDGNPVPLEAKAWDVYKDTARYPLDADDATTPTELAAMLTQACRDDPGEWRERFVGAQFDPALFVARFEAALSNRRSA